MTTINNKEQQFKAGIEGLKRVKMAPEEKGVLFRKLSRYAEAHPKVAVSEAFLAMCLRFFKKVFVTVK